MTLLATLRHPLSTFGKIWADLTTWERSLLLALLPVAAAVGTLVGAALALGVSALFPPLIAACR